MANMKEILADLVCAIVDHPDDVVVTEEENKGVKCTKKAVYFLHTAFYNKTDVLRHFSTVLFLFLNFKINRSK